MTQPPITIGPSNYSSSTDGFTLPYSRSDTTMGQPDLSTVNFSPFTLEIFADKIYDPEIFPNPESQTTFTPPIRSSAALHVGGLTFLTFYYNFSNEIIRFY